MFEEYKYPIKYIIKKIINEIKISEDFKKNLSLLLKIFKNNILKQIAAALCLAKDDKIRPRKNCFLFLFEKLLMQIILPKIKIKSFKINGTAI
tara:strand:+ start:350 stop:628 length:279 start_codon:yes stop_codon:yes gene_type:complete